MGIYMWYSVFDVCFYRIYTSALSMLNVAQNVRVLKGAYYGLSKSETKEGREKNTHTHAHSHKTKQLLLCGEKRCIYVWVCVCVYLLAHWMWMWMEMVHFLFQSMCRLYSLCKTVKSRRINCLVKWVNIMVRYGYHLYHYMLWFVGRSIRYALLLFLLNKTPEL